MGFMFLLGTKKPSGNDLMFLTTFFNRSEKELLKKVLRYERKAGLYLSKWQGLGQCIERGGLRDIKKHLVNIS